MTLEMVRLSRRQHPAFHEISAVSHPRGELLDPAHLSPRQDRTSPGQRTFIASEMDLTPPPLPGDLSGAHPCSKRLGMRRHRRHQRDPRPVRERQLETADLPTPTEGNGQKSIKFRHKCFD